MDRRSVLRSVVSAVAGAGLVATARDAAQSEETKTVGARAKVCSAPCVETTDGGSLFYRDWGTGRPIVFAAPWALHSDWWEHQMAFLAGQGLRCIGLDRRRPRPSSQARARLRFRYAGRRSSDADRATRSARGHLR